MTLFETYALFTLLPNIKSLFDLLCFLCCVGSLVCGIGIIVTSDYDDYNDKRLEKIHEKVSAAFKTLCISALVFALLEAPIPNENQIYRIAGSYIVTNNAQAMQLPNNLMDAANTFLQDYTNSLKKKETNQ